jgi:hypothetical protein
MRIQLQEGKDNRTSDFWCSNVIVYKESEEEIRLINKLINVQLRNVNKTTEMY